MKVLEANPENIKLAAVIIREGGLVVCPTNSVYGILCDANKKEALDKIRKIRNSPADKPLTIVVAKQDIKKYAFVNEREEKIIASLLPSPVSIFLQKKKDCFPDAIPHEDTICIFWQNSEVLQLYNYAQCPLAITSANKKGQPDPIHIDETVRNFGTEVDIYLKVEGYRGNKPNLQLDIRNNGLKVIRDAPHFTFDLITRILKENGLH
jgi:L-threonylcarbamoyladenylate synthase